MTEEKIDTYVEACVEGSQRNSYETDKSCASCA